MARAELRYGRNEWVRRLAQEIIVTQQDEIRVMQLALDNLPPAARTSTMPAQRHAMQAGAQ